MRSVEPRTWPEVVAMQSQQLKGSSLTRYAKRFFLTKMYCGTTKVYLPCLWPALIVLLVLAIYFIVKRLT